MHAKHTAFVSGIMKGWGSGYGALSGRNGNIAHRFASLSLHQTAIRTAKIDGSCRLVSRVPLGSNLERCPFNITNVNGREAKINFRS